MKIDLYTRVILTIIAISLLIIAFQPLLLPKSPMVYANPDSITVNIEKLGGWSISGGTLPVEIKNIRDLK